MTHTTRFTVFTDFDDVPHKIALTPSETYFVLTHCHDLNSFVDYIRSLPRDRIVRLEGE